MNLYYKPLELAQRYHQIETELAALSTVYGDFKTLNITLRNERSAIRRVIDELQAEKKSIENALSTLNAVKVER